MPDTFAFYVAGYVVAGLLYAGYVASLVARARKARGDADRQRTAT